MRRDSGIPSTMASAFSILNEPNGSDVEEAVASKPAASMRRALLEAAEPMIALIFLQHPGPAPGLIRARLPSNKLKEGVLPSGHRPGAKGGPLSRFRGI